jgi:flagellar protein FlaG
MMDIKNIVSFPEQTAQSASVKHFSKPELNISDDKDLNQAVKKPALADSDEVASKLQKKDVEQALAEVNQFFQAEQRKLSFSINEATKGVVIEVKDAETNEIIRQIPPEFVVKMAEHLDKLSSESGGLLLKEKA